MSFSSEHRRLAPVLAYARQLDIATNPVPNALFEALTAGFNVWCTPEDDPQEWDGILLIAGAFAKPCGFVGTATWNWKDEQIVAISLETDAYDLADQRPEVFARKTSAGWISIHNRSEDIEWADEKVRWVFQQAGVPCPYILIE